MARRPGEDGRFSLSPRARLIGGWVVAILLIVGIAVIVGLLGGNGDGAAVLPSSSASTSAAPAGAEITFGAAIDPVTGEVAQATITDTFTRGDAFAYSLRPAEPPPTPIYVEVRRVGSGPIETVQAAAPQPLPPGAEIIAFVVSATALVDDFGTGDFEMRIYDVPNGQVIGFGAFRLVGEGVMPSSSPPLASPVP